MGERERLAEARARLPGERVVTFGSIRGPELAPIREAVERWDRRGMRAYVVATARGDKLPNHFSCISVLSRQRKEYHVGHSVDDGVDGRVRRQKITHHLNRVAIRSHGDMERRDEATYPSAVIGRDEGTENRLRRRRARMQQQPHAASVALFQSVVDRVRNTGFAYAVRRRFALEQQLHAVVAAKMT